MTLPAADITAPRRRPRPDGVPPTDDQLALIVEAATTVPDHGGLAPWRFVVVTGPSREPFGEALAADTAASRPGAPPAVIEKARHKAFAAPCHVVLVAAPDPGSNVPGWEQVASASCAGYAVVLAATALGLGAIWKSAAVMDGPAVRRLFGLGEHEHLLGWVNLGSADDRTGGPGLVLRPPPAPAEVASVLLPDASTTPLTGRRAAGD